VAEEEEEEDEEEREQEEPRQEEEDQEEEEEEEEEEEDAAGDTRAVWLRGPSQLPQRPIPLARRPMIRPVGDSRTGNTLCYTLLQVLDARAGGCPQKEAQRHPGNPMQGALPWAGDACREPGAGIHVGPLHRRPRCRRSGREVLRQQGETGGGRILGKSSHYIGE